MKLDRARSRVGRVVRSPWAQGAAAIAVVLLALWVVLRDPVADPARIRQPAVTAAPVTGTTPSPPGTTPVDAARLTSAATRYQADRAAAAAEQTARIQAAATDKAARTQAFAADRTGRRAALLAMLAGGIALMSAWLGWQAHRETVRRNTRDADDALTERRDERYTTAISHLTHEKSPAARAAGAYALQDLVASDSERRLPVLQTLIAFLTERLPAPDLHPDVDHDPAVRDPSSDAAEIPVDVIAATLAIALIRDKYSAPPAKLLRASLAGLPLAGANLAGADLRGAELIDADLAGAELADADLASAHLRRTDLHGANLYRSNLAGADLTDANLRGAHLHGATLAGATLADANLADADLSRAYLVDANLSRSNLAGADLRRTDLRRTDLTGANLTDATLPGANLADRVDEWGTHPLEDWPIDPGWGTHPSHEAWAIDPSTGRASPVQN